MVGQEQEVSYLLNVFYNTKKLLHSSVLFLMTLFSMSGIYFLTSKFFYLKVNFFLLQTPSIFIINSIKNINLNECVED